MVEVIKSENTKEGKTLIRLLYAVLHEEMEEDFVDDLPDGLGHYEVMLFLVPVLIELNGTWEKYPVHTCIVYHPDQPIHYKAANGRLIYDWIRFDCDEPFFTDRFIPFGKPFPCYDYYNFNHYWHEIAYENVAGYRTRDYVLTQLMLILLYRLHDYAMQHPTVPYQNALQNLRDELYLNPAFPWTLSGMAARLNISVRLLQKNYKALFGTSCMSDVINARISRAMHLLKNTDNTVQDISSLCGYHNTEHFCRQFKKHTGIPPGIFRRTEADETTLP